MTAYPNLGYLALRNVWGAEKSLDNSRQSSFPSRCICYLMMTSFIEHLLSARLFISFKFTTVLQVQITIIPHFQTRKLKFKESSDQSQITQLAKLVEQILEPRSEWAKLHSSAKPKLTEGMWLPQELLSGQGTETCSFRSDLNPFVQSHLMDHLPKKLMFYSSHFPYRRMALRVSEFSGVSPYFAPVE